MQVHVADIRCAHSSRRNTQLFAVQAARLKQRRGTEPWQTSSSPSTRFTWCGQSLTDLS